MNFHSSELLNINCEAMHVLNIRSSYKTRSYKRIKINLFQVFNEVSTQQSLFAWLEKRMELGSPSQPGVLKSFHLT